MAAMRVAEEATAAGRVKAARTTTAAASAAMPTPSGSAPCPPAADNNDLVGGDDHDESGDGEGEGEKGHGHVGTRDGEVVVGPHVGRGSAVSSCGCLAA